MGKGYLSACLNSRTCSRSNSFDKKAPSWSFSVQTLEGLGIIVALEPSAVANRDRSHRRPGSVDLPNFMAKIKGRPPEFPVCHSKTGLLSSSVTRAGQDETGRKVNASRLSEERHRDHVTNP